MIDVHSLQTPHQYVDRDTGAVKTERFVGDRLLNLLYHAAHEDATLAMKALTSATLSEMLGFLLYDRPFAATLTNGARWMLKAGIDATECLDPLDHFDTPRKVFERKIRYWEVRPMPESPHVVTSPCDARVLWGSFAETSSLFLKRKFFDYGDLIGGEHTGWSEAFHHGEFAIFRLTPDRYHYNHVPVDGVVLDLYELPGAFHSCNPGPVTHITIPYSKNKRVVTILDTDIPGGTQVGLVAMIEIVALMVGSIRQCYSEVGYADPCAIQKGQRLRRGQPKSLYKPGSSTTVLVFQRGRVEPWPDILANMGRPGVQSRYSRGFGKPLVETDLKVRSPVANARIEVESTTWSSFRAGGCLALDQ